MALAFSITKSRFSQFRPWLHLHQQEHRQTRLNYLEGIAPSKRKKKNCSWRSSRVQGTFFGTGLCLRLPVLSPWCHIFFRFVFASLVLHIGLLVLYVHDVQAVSYLFPTQFAEDDHDEQSSATRGRKNENLFKHGWVSERAAELNPQTLFGLQQIYRSLDGKECDGLVPATIYPEPTAPDCEAICVSIDRCEAWLFYNRTCLWGNPFPERCKGEKSWYPRTRGRSRGRSYDGDVEAERSWYDGSNGTESLWPELAESLREEEGIFPESRDATAAAWNRRVVGGRLRWFAWRFTKSPWHETLRLYSEKAVLTDLREEDESRNSGKVAGDQMDLDHVELENDDADEADFHDSMSARSSTTTRQHSQLSTSRGDVATPRHQPEQRTTRTQPPPPRTPSVYERTRLAYRVGHHTNPASLRFCQRRRDDPMTGPADPDEFPWARHVEDSRELARKHFLRETSRYSLLRLRAAVPMEMRTGRWLNFGIGPCGVGDPMHPFFHHRLRGEDARLVDHPPLNGVGFERALDGFSVADFCAVGYAPGCEGAAKAKTKPALETRFPAAAAALRSDLRGQVEGPPRARGGSEVEVEVAAGGDRGGATAAALGGDEEQQQQHEDDWRLQQGCRFYRNTTVLFDTVTPTNVISTLRKTKPEWFSTPFSSSSRDTTMKTSSTSKLRNVIEFVILDIDSHDYQILRELVAASNPALENALTVLVYMVEIATHFPPPLKYAKIYQPADVFHESEQVASGERGRHTIRYEGLSGVSFSMVLDLLKDTHDFLMFPDLGDALFVHKALRESVEAAYEGVRLPMDEFRCFAGSHLFMYPTWVVKQWTFLENFESVHDMLPWVWQNVTASVEKNKEHQFMLYV